LLFGTFRWVRCCGFSEVETGHLIFEMGIVVGLCGREVVEVAAYRALDGGVRFRVINR